MYKKYKEIAEQMGPGTTVEDVKEKFEITWTFQVANLTFIINFKSYKIEYNI